jgi:hypothetical protein
MGVYLVFLTMAEMVSRQPRIFIPLFPSSFGCFIEAGTTLIATSPFGGSLPLVYQGLLFRGRQLARDMELFLKWVALNYPLENQIFPEIYQAVNQLFWGSPMTMETPLSWG